MVRDGWYFLLPTAAAALGCLYLGAWAPGLVFVLAASFVAFFFRNPERIIPPSPDAIVSPADGRVISLEKGEQGTKLSIFLSVFNVHVARAPIEGEIVRQEHRPGRFLVAYDPRASVENEQLVITIRGRRQLSFALIAGIVARRIRPWKKQGDRVNKGDRIALIRFGSRVDMVLSPDCEIKVRMGGRVRGGSSVIAYWRDKP